MTRRGARTPEPRRSAIVKAEWTTEPIDRKNMIILYLNAHGSGGTPSWNMFQLFFPSTKWRTDAASSGRMFCGRQGSDDRPREAMCCSREGTIQRHCTGFWQAGTKTSGSVLSLSSRHEHPVGSYVWRHWICEDLDRWVFGHNRPRAGGIGTAVR